jgi:hypothetical protein
MLSVKKLFFSQKWSYLNKCLGLNSHQSISKTIFFSSRFIRSDKQVQLSNFWTSTFEKISKMLIFLSFLAIFAIFEAEARPSALKIFESCRIKVVPNDCSQLLRLQPLLIFAYFDFAPP